MINFLLKNKKTILIIVFLLSLLISAGLLIVYYCHFPFISDNPQDWAAFGSYVSGTVSSIGIYVSIIVNIMIAILVNQFTRETNNKQMQNSKQIAIVQLRNDIYKEFINKSMPLFVEWEYNNSNITVAENCIKYLKSFEKFNSHLFDFSKIESYSELIITTYSAIDSMKLNDIGAVLQKQLKASELLNEIYIKMGKHVTDIEY
jgi:hypothetical protein